MFALLRIADYSLFLQSSELGLPLPPHTKMSTYPSLRFRGGTLAHSLAVEVLGSPNSDEWTHTVVLYIYFCTLWLIRSANFCLSLIC